jgi:hypothetical protein
LKKGLRRVPGMPPVEPIMPLRADGESASTAGSIASRNKIGDAFLAHVASSNPELATRWGAKWAEVPEECACSNEVHEFMAQYLTTVYTIPKGRQNAGLHLKQDSAVEYWGGIIYDLKKRFQHSTEHSTKVSSRACAAYACLPAERAPAASAARACAVRLPLLRSLPLRLLSVLATNWVTFVCT